MTRHNRALLVDLDGTLADTVPTLVRVYEAFVRSHGGEPSMDEFQALNGLPIAAALRELCTARAWDLDVEELLRRYEEAIDVNYLSAEPREGAHALLTNARDHGWRVAVVTSGSRSRAQEWLRAHDLDSLVDVVIGAEDVTSGKPDPEPYKRALELLDTDPQQSIAIEDSLAGMESAQGAGAKTYFLEVTQTVAPPGVHTLASLAELGRLLIERSVSSPP